MDWFNFLGGNKHYLSEFPQAYQEIFYIKEIWGKKNEFIVNALPWWYFNNLLEIQFSRSLLSASEFSENKMQSTPPGLYIRPDIVLFLPRNHNFDIEYKTAK